LETQNHGYNRRKGLTGMRGKRNANKHTGVDFSGTINSLMLFIQGYIKKGKLPSARVLSEEIGGLTNGLIFPLTYWLREENGDYTEAIDYSTLDGGFPPSEISTQARSYNEAQISKWYKEAQLDTSIDIVTSLRVLLSDLLYRNFHIGQLLRYSDDYVVIPHAREGGPACEECKKVLEGHVYWVSPDFIAEPTKQECGQYLWINKDLVDAPPQSYLVTLPFHSGCRHILVRFKGGDPDDYFIDL